MLLLDGDRTMLSQMVHERETVQRRVYLRVYELVMGTSYSVRSAGDGLQHAETFDVQLRPCTPSALRGRGS